MALSPLSRQSAFIGILPRFHALYWSSFVFLQLWKWFRTGLHTMNGALYRLLVFFCRLYHAFQFKTSPTIWCRFIWTARNPYVFCGSSQMAFTGLSLASFCFRVYFWKIISPLPMFFFFFFAILGFANILRLQRAEPSEWSILSFTGFYWVSMGSTDPVSFSLRCQVVPELVFKHHWPDSGGGTLY